MLNVLTRFVDKMLNVLIRYVDKNDECFDKIC